MQGYVKAPPILKQARALHRDTATNIALREHIRIHKASIAEYEHEINSIDKYTEDLNELSQRIRIISKALDYYQSTAETNLEQLQNLLSLVRNALFVTLPSPDILGVGFKAMISDPNPSISVSVLLIDYRRSTSKRLVKA